MSADRDQTDPLSIWTPEIAELTRIPRSEISQLYSELLKHIDSKHFKNKLAQHPELWLAN